MKKIGITGGIGSGKSTVCRVFSALGIPVYYADEAAKRLMQHDHLLKTAIREHFGHETYDSTGNLNRVFLAKTVFNNKEKLALLNSLVHPVTIKDAEKWAEKQEAPYVIKEAALMFESEAFHYVDKIIGVSAPLALRIKRTMDRDQVDRDEVMSRMKNQMDEETKMKMCDYIIYNDEQQAVIPQVLDLHEKILNL
ncbi:MAG: dephospho-CoA kinase [Chitinophagaceae bacterium]|nr:MAG: dephospho-CoA kinase [Chitinophagaceae bacterium]